MPGIAGIISRAPAADCRRTLGRMLQTMMHEPFYTNGTCTSEEVGVYAGWVAHPDSLADALSGRDVTGSIDVAFAGECVQKDDLLSLYRRLGEDAIGQLNGLFSGLLIDRPRRCALLFNDRYGVERLYVHEANEAVYFASEAKAILRVVPAVREFDDTGVAEYLTFGCTLDCHTLFRGISRLDAASIWTVQNGSCRKRRYFHPREWEEQEPLSAEAYERELRERLCAAVPRYARTSGRLGISLTGGLDTRMIMACLPEQSPPPVCYTFAGLDGETRDVRIASQVAAACGLDHHTVRIGSDFLANYGDYVDRTVYITDGAAGALTAHEIYLNAKARVFAPVRLTGNFGSEVLRSMSTFKPLRLSPYILAPEFRVRLPRDTAMNGLAPVTFAAFREIPWSIFGTIAAAKSQMISRTPFLDNDIVSLAYRAPASARQSTESCLRFVRTVQPSWAALPTDRREVVGGGGFVYAIKRIATEIAFKLDYWHHEALQPSVLPLDAALAAFSRAGMLGKHKYLPFRRWYRRELAQYVADVTTDPAAVRMGYWDRQSLATLAIDHARGSRNYLREINAVVSLVSADRLLLSGWTRHSSERDAVAIADTAKLRDACSI